MNKPITANSSASFICRKYSRIFFPRPENRQVASPAFLPLTSPPSQTVSESTKCLSSSVISGLSTVLRIDSARNPCFERREKSVLDPSHSFGMTTRYFGHCDTVSRGGVQKGGRTQPPPRPLPRISTPSVLWI